MYGIKGIDWVEKTSSLVSFAANVIPAKPLHVIYLLPGDLLGLNEGAAKKAIVIGSEMLYHLKAPKGPNTFLVSYVFQ